VNQPNNYKKRIAAQVVLWLTAVICGCSFAQGLPATTDPLPKTKIDEAAAAAPKSASVLDDPLTGIVVNRTVTVLGHDFYREFSGFWRQKDISSRFTISIHERPSARFGSEVWVEYRQNRVFHAFLPPARAQTERISAAAVEIVYQNIADSEVARAMFRSPDLAPEEL